MSIVFAHYSFKKRPAGHALISTILLQTQLKKSHSKPMNMHGINYHCTNLHFFYSSPHPKNGSEKIVMAF